MKTVLVTGSQGFIGKNLCSCLRYREDVVLLELDISDDHATLAELVERADVVVHLAGVNRPKNENEFAVGNYDLTREVLDLMSKTGRKIPLLFTSSIQATLQNAYGASKKAAEEAIFRWANARNGDAYVFRLPNVFGKWCRPDYNSVVATFCNNIARGQPIRIDDPSTELRLVYIDDVVSSLVSAIDGRLKPDTDGFCYVPRVFTCTVGRLAELIRSFAASRNGLVMPNLAGEFERFLYATYSSHLPGLTYDLEQKVDSRGWLAEFIKSHSFGQIFLSKTKPGITRGNHWHHTKVEKFLVIQGEAGIELRKIGSGDRFEVRVSGDHPTVIDIPAGYTHSITNIGTKDLVTLFWSDEIFDPNRPDTMYLEV